MDRDPSIARVTLDLPRHHLPELMAYLGGFVADHDIIIGVGKDLEVVSGASLYNEGISYARERAVLIQNSDGEMVATVTKGNLNAFAKETGQKPGRAERLINAFRFSIRRNTQPLLKGMLVGQEGEFGFGVAGIRVDSFRALIDQLENNGIVISNVGKTSTDLLKQYTEVLFPQPAL